MRATARQGRLTMMLGASVALLSGHAALAQQAAAPAPAVQDEYADEVDAVTVTASRNQPGSVIGDIPPEVQLSPRDIRAYGVSSVSELITALEPQTSTGKGGAAGGRPVILVNGARISNFGEVRDIPTEAIARVDILPEEVALKYGYRADQKVVNLVLRRRFNAKTVEAGYKASTDEGGGDTVDVRGNRLQILRDNRFMLDGKFSDQSKLVETDRDLAQPRADAAFRTLVPDTRSASLNAVLSRPLGDKGVSGTLNASIEGNESTAWLGQNTLATGPLKRESDSVTGHLGAGAAGSVKGWRWSFTANAEQAKSDSTTQRIVSGVSYLDQSNSKTTSADSQLDVGGTLFRIPAGAVTTTVTGKLEALRLDTRSVRAGVSQSGDLSRDTATAKLNLDVPITSVRNDVLAKMGDLSLNFNFAADQLSDFGGLTTLGYGVNWAPADKVRLIASVTMDEGAPTLAQIGDPVQVTPGVQTYDFRRGVTSVISRVTGGNANLRESDSNVFKLGLNLKPLGGNAFTVSTNYLNSRTNNLISSFPTGTSQIEAAFPERFVRDASGVLVSIDARPVNFSRRDTEELRTGFTWRKTFGPQPGQRQPGQQGQGQQGQGQQGQGQQRQQGQATSGQPGQGAQGGQTGQQNPLAQALGGPPEGGPPPESAGGGGGGQGFGGPGGGGRGFGGPGGPGGFGGPPGSGVFQIGAYHTIKFRDEILIRPGVAKLDLLDGASIGSSGGTPKNQFDVQANFSRSGLGASLNAKWQEGTTVRGSGAVGSQDLDYSALTTINLRLFADLGQQEALRAKPFFRGARVVASIDNVFDAKQKVRAPDGSTPITYQEDYLDPRGRTVRVSFRKVFFPPPPARTGSPPGVAPGSTPNAPRQGAAPAAAPAAQPRT